MAVWDERAVTTGEKRDYGRTRGDKTERGSCPSVGIVGETQGRGTDAESREGEGAGRPRSGKAKERRGQTGSRAPKGHNGAQDAEAICENRRGREQEVWGGRRQREKRRHLGDIEASWGTGGGPRESDVIAGK